MYGSGDATRRAEEELRTAKEALKKIVDEGETKAALIAAKALLKILLQKGG
jgi:vacuolar-type H+-ATPase subunit H